MKATKLILGIVFLAFSTMAFAQSAGLDQPVPVPGPRCVKITLSQALQNHGLVAAMYDQLSASMLSQQLTVVVTFKVKYDRKIYFITGTFKEWKGFFSHCLDADPER